MKIKITNPWISIIWFLLAIVLFVVGLKLEQDVFIVPGVILMAILHVIYFPVLAIVVVRRKDENAKSVVNYLGLYAIFNFVTSVFLKLYHLPGAGVIIILGAFVFSLIFLPSWFFINWPSQDKWARLLSFLFSSFMGSFMIYWLFKAQYWPYGTLIGNIAETIFYYLFIPVLVLVLLFSRKSITINLNDSLIISFVFAYLFSGVQTGKMMMAGMARSTDNQEKEEKKLTNYIKKNNFLYESLLSSQEKDTLFLEQKNLAMKLKEKSDSVFNYIKEVKLKMISDLEGVSKEVADTISFDEISNKSNSDVINRMFIGSDHMSPIQGSMSAVEIKSVLEKYKSQALKYAPKEIQPQLKSNCPIELLPVEYEGGYKETWEVHNFFNEQFGKVYTTLTMLQSDVRYTEQLVLSEIYNKANFSRKDNIAAQLAEISAKYENEKKEKQIALLEKDKEVSEVKIQAKDAEISDREKTITYFVIAMALFLFMLVFVVRSNFLRKEANQKLEAQNSIISQQKNEVEQQKHLVEEKQREIVDSINYARRIQYTLLANDEFIRHYLPQHFVFFHPKDIVSGDFYWATFVKNKSDHFGKFFLAVCDSTGHGVPGAFMSLLNISFLNEAISEKGILAPHEVLNYVRQKLIENISKEGQKDGFDGILICMDTTTKEITYSAANNAPLLVSANGEYRELPKDRMPVGMGERKESFQLFSLEYQTGDSLYLYTDGYADQFGGDKGKKFKYKQLNDLILNNHSLSLEQQENILKTKFHQWKGDLEQVDDVCILGIKL